MDSTNVSKALPLNTNASPVFSLQQHADLRLAWKLVSDAGHEAAADRIFAMLNAPPNRSSNSPLSPWAITQPRELIVAAPVGPNQLASDDDAHEWKDGYSQGFSAGEWATKALSFQAGYAAAMEKAAAALEQLATDSKEVSNALTLEYAAASIRALPKLGGA